MKTFLYQLLEDGSIFSLRDNKIIPTDPFNVDFQEFLTSMLCGNIPESATEEWADKILKQFGYEEEDDDTNRTN